MEHLFCRRCYARCIACISYKPHNTTSKKKKKNYYPYRTNEEQEAQSINNLPVVTHFSTLKPTLCPLMHFFLSHCSSQHMQSHKIAK